MKTIRFFIGTFLLTCLVLQIHAQTESTDLKNGPAGLTNVKNKSDPQRNLIKVNLTAILLKNYSIQYERVLNKSISVAVAFRTMPSTTLPFKNTLLEIAGDDADSRDLIENFELSNIAITPEVRFYLGRKGYGRGFYIAPFYRYAKFKTNHWLVTVDNTTENKTLNLAGDLTSNTGGIMFGAQWALGRYVCLDWWILGPHYGKATGNFVGVPNKPLTPAEQDDLRTSLDDLDLPLTDKTIVVTANKASLTLDGPWAGVRAGISIGIKF